MDEKLLKEFADVGCKYNSFYEKYAELVHNRNSARRKMLKSCGTDTYDESVREHANALVELEKFSSSKEWQSVRNEFKRLEALVGSDYAGKPSTS